MQEQEQQTPSEGRAGADSTAEAPARRRRGWLSALVAGVALVAVVVVFAAVALGRQRAAPSQSALGAMAAPTSWRVYNDPMGLYSIRIPANWTASVTDGTFSEGNRTGSMSGKLEGVVFRDPALGKASARIWINAEQITSAFGRQYYCDARAQETSSFNGYSASLIPPSGTVWMFESYNAHFQIDVEIPGVLAPSNPGGPMIPYPPPPTPTPLPQTMVKADRAILTTALDSFKPAAKPLPCA